MYLEFHKDVSFLTHPHKIYDMVGNITKKRECSEQKISMENPGSNLNFT